ncbi:hypothetical protein PVK74_13630 [Micromonospora chalcea]|uniref:hypothetical protein n=1 Tax=Micromonospora chalcea TaxID=1874 RepID=UPI002377DD86|nr:hypothetical protein [Micromonospora chalcea]WDQ02781.1 hypothetical protein PVK74_13630 [Micromonospora chalcea]
MERLRDLAVRLAMDEPVGDDLAMAAAHALARGVDSPSLRGLAGLSKGQSREAVDLFRQAMEELGSPVPDESGARLHLMRAAAASIIDGEGDPEDLAHEIYWQSSYFPSGKAARGGLPLPPPVRRLRRSAGSDGGGGGGHEGGGTVVPARPSRLTAPSLSWRSAQRANGSYARASATTSSSVNSG